MEWSGAMLILFIIIITLILDQWTKYLITSQMILNQSIPVINNFFHITYVKNPGAAFGILPYQTTFFIIVTVLVVVVLGYYAFSLNKNQLLLKVAFALQIGGAIGNFIDRIRTGYVVDFLDFKIWSPVFNVADVAIVLGVSLFALQVVTEIIKDKKAEV
ncbi:signal peptidase II . Aspartic peptidase. MEROPS family A08 [Anaerobranca californiensis DSM 14826]|jgi:signal peptidase II|uniref:Lipoprotein signal peptidase n=1 Tax=Anaerobranca californiensis DSM 14826 TaxID=1120989 RepID=A0A1M6KS16_9FIRM|nr:signal peptidase II [Anaerobranca californiensis]SHJ61763.1 signal peptidase II . Aspartic peptidase. MEROPS family A08 [Anaerobranca californiensis DSM 14826]